MCTLLARASSTWASLQLLDSKNRSKFVVLFYEFSSVINCRVGDHVGIWHELRSMVVQIPCEIHPSYLLVKIKVGGS